MNISRVAIIGVGSLGGFVAQSISELESIRKLTVIDYDIVEEKNLINSIYRSYDVGKYKTSALHDIIKEQNLNNISIEILTCKYVENQTEIPDTDLIIDCRDQVCDRGNNIDIRLFISSRYLIIDCRKNVYYTKEYEGQYVTRLTKNDLRRSSLIFSSFMQDNFIEYMINNKLIKEVDIDYLNKVSNDIKNQNRQDMIIDSEISTKLLNLEDNIKEIMVENKHKDLMITMSDNNSTQIIPKKTINNPIDVISTLSQMTQLGESSQYYYIISMVNENNNNCCHIELIRESGAA